MPAKKPIPHVKPAGLELRDGRPCWRPSPTLRKAGWGRLDLKDHKRDWCSIGAAFDIAEAINRAVAIWRLDPTAPLPELVAPIAPAASSIATAPKAVSPAKVTRQIGPLIDLFLADPAPHGIVLKPNSISHYRSNLNVFIRSLAACRIEEPARSKLTREGIERLALDVRRQDIELLRGPKPGEIDHVTYVGVVYKHLLATRTKHVANAVHRTASAFLAWCVRSRNVLTANPCDLVKRVQAPGRRVEWSHEELAAFVAAADALGVPSIGDAAILARDLAWNRQDVLAIRWADLDPTRRTITGVERIKTGTVMGDVDLMPPAERRILQIIARWRAIGRELPAMLIAQTSAGGSNGGGKAAIGQGWGYAGFRHNFLRCRTEAAKTVPTIAKKNFQDLRDTGITDMWNAGLTCEEIAMRSGHRGSIASIEAILKKHYINPNQRRIDAVWDKLRTHHKAREQAAPPSAANVA